ncbi:MAG TPA: tryptophan-rich sensory protein [Candidatus Omnitrophota bacterium]|nr:tryptophan-rich sensory protein [Candidatus Omnitrophota bacterium]
MNLKKIATFLFFLLLSHSAGIVGSFFTIPAIPEWYNFLQKPSLSPPNWVFAPVWTTLFTLMALAAYLVWNKGMKEPAVRSALAFFLAQLALNSLWSFVFFGLRSPFYGLLEIFVLWIAILITILQFLKISKLAAALMIPYLLWVSYASGLNLGIFLLNR